MRAASIGVPRLVRCGRAQTKRVGMVCPGFVSDCLETLEEIAIEVRQKFPAAGGAGFHHIPALNERPEWIAAPDELIPANLGGWVSPTGRLLTGINILGSILKKHPLTCKRCIKQP